MQYSHDPCVENDILVYIDISLCENETTFNLLRSTDRNMSP